RNAVSKAAIFWGLIEEKRRELIQEYVANRKAKIAAGEPDPYPQQPKDYQGLFLVTIQLPKIVDPDSRGGQITCCNFALAARKIVGENNTPTHVVASTEQIERYFVEARERITAARKNEDMLNAHRTHSFTRAEPLAPKARS